ncbi:DsbA family protein [Profundibacterium mesophilum]|uniref:Outer membrane protein n=1 Tax=Profundibacterium mesophilum KAUST100406-0324 TaxID=1037889 RepID=A0A921P0L6_9RHOB|nr:DsbA family protein [Profundibacterium mesophilum]KAF0677003.1 Outer membrane protein [Profundibacterium mesophilum KAUST100406-0324]
MAFGRRHVVFLGGAAALVAGFQLAPRLAPVGDLEFTPHPTLPDFRRLGAGGTSAAGFDLLTGGLTDAQSPARPAIAPQDICAALFGDAPVAAGMVPIAYFTDYFCPYCRVLGELLLTMAREDPRIRLTLHETPILGPGSEAAARAALAAGLQGAQRAAHERLRVTPFIPTAAYLRELAAELDLDAERLLADRDAPEVDAALGRSAALFGAFGFVGTPGLVVGRTAVNGEIGAPLLRKLVEAEAALPPPC